VARKATLSLKALTADLHIHTCLSPCASLDMTPLKIVGAAIDKKLALIAVTDHNSAENTSAVMKAARETGLCVIPGIEVTTREEAHIVGLFQEVEAALSMQALVYGNLQPGENDEDLFGIQVVANERDEVERISRRLLIGATRLGLNETVEAIHDRGGLAIAAHIDRGSFSIVSQLGFIPEDVDLDALEISSRLTLDEARSRFAGYGRFPFVASSDAHQLEQVGANPASFRLAHANMAELKMALAGRDGRMVLGTDD
jgi:predicted metal-dependent phosphoesterase TrpH